MKLFVIIMSISVLAFALTYTTSADGLQRNIGQQQNRNISSTTEINISPEKFKKSIFLLKDVNKYSTVRKLGVLKRRDVSHLDLAYLPPDVSKIKSSNVESPTPSEVFSISPSKELPTSPSKEFLPPYINESNTHVSTENNTNNITKLSNETIPAQLLNEYLPPAVEMAKVNPELPQSSFNKYSTSIKMSEDFLEKPLETFLKTEERIENVAKSNEQFLPVITSEEIIEATFDVDQNTALLDEDGYHYKIPKNIPALYPLIAPAAGYLPPKERDVGKIECISNK